MQIEVNEDGHNVYTMDSFQDLTLLKPEQVDGALADLATAIKYMQTMRQNALLVAEAMGADLSALGDAVGVEMQKFQWIDDGEYGVNGPLGTKLTLGDEVVLSVNHKKVAIADDPRMQPIDPEQVAADINTLMEGYNLDNPGPRGFEQPIK